MQTLPDELTDAATIDGWGDLGTFVESSCPLNAGSGLLAIFSFIGGWNDSSGRTSCQYRKITDRTDCYCIAEKEYSMIGYQLTGATIATVPMLIIFIFFQKYFVRGITVGAVKG